MRNLIFLDCETTGLDPDNDKLVELSWAVNDGPINTVYFGVEEVPKFIDNLISFTKREIAGKLSTDSAFNQFLADSNDQTVVAANRYFDQRFLENYGLWNAHYRAIEMGSYAMGRLGLDYIPGMKDIEREVEARGYTIPVAADHTSANDVNAMRYMFNVLKYL
jgi:DNA polymerase III alpha subunit (gram-positive type)